MFYNEMTSSGLDLYQVFDNAWVIDFKDGNAFYGTFKECVTYLTFNLFFNLSDIEEAVIEMIRMNCNASHFGIYKSLIYTFQKEINYGSKAS